MGTFPPLSKLSWYNLKRIFGALWIALGGSAGTVDNFAILPCQGYYEFVPFQTLGVHKIDGFPRTL